MQICIVRPPLLYVYLFVFKCLLCSDIGLAVMSDEHTELSALKHHLNTLTSLSEQLEQVRSSPANLLESGLPPNNSLPGLTASLFQTTSPKRSGDISAAFQHLGQLSQQLQQPGSEAALQSAASLSEGNNAPTVTDVQNWWAERCELRLVNSRLDLQPKLLMHPGFRKSQSTDPGILNFEEPPPSRPVFVPPLYPDTTPLSNSKLRLFIKSFNKARSNRRMSVRICCHDKPPATLKDPITVRMVLEDVLIAYITLGFDDLTQGQSSPLSVEFVSVFGSRETVGLQSNPSPVAAEVNMGSEATPYFL
jgi:hypothetical protein